MAYARARRIARTAATAVLATGIGLTAVIGFAHTKVGHPLLPYLGMGHAKAGGRCPFGFDKNRSPAEIEAGRRHFAESHHGEAQAAERPALGFVLDKTTRGDVEKWARAVGATCSVPRAMADYECRDVPADRLPQGGPHVPLNALWFNFGANDTVTSVIAIRHDPSLDTIGSAFDAVNRELDHAGAPTRVDGDASPEHLRGLLSQASAEYRFRDYYAVTRASNMGKDYMLTEEYRSLPTL